MENAQNQPVDYTAVLADLLARRDALDRAIEAVRPLAGQSSAKTINGTNVEIRDDSFFGLTIPDAIRKLLGMKRQPLTPNEIANLLESGGVTHSSVNFVNTVGSVLHRMAKGDTGVVQTKRGQYGLMEWYPGFKRSKAGKKNEEAEPDNSTDAEGSK